MVSNSGEASDYAEIIKKAQNQPGIIELMKAYGQYELLTRQSAEYLNSIPPKVIIFTSDST
jgi:hypothetical protein